MVYFIDYINNYIVFIQKIFNVNKKFESNIKPQRFNEKISKNYSIYFLYSIKF